MKESQTHHCRSCVDNDLLVKVKNVQDNTIWISYFVLQPKNSICKIIANTIPYVPSEMSHTLIPVVSVWSVVTCAGNGISPGTKTLTSTA